MSNIATEVEVEGKESEEHVSTSSVPEEPSSSLSGETDNTIKSTTVLVPRRKRYKKDNCMPTWAATNSLILVDQGNFPRKMRSEVMAPFLLRSPTDMSTLYTALKLTQNVNAYVCGSGKKNGNNP